MRWFRTSRKKEWLQITIGNSENPKVKKKKRQRKTNRIQSTKYTLITFLPQNLLEQFRRLSNFYFLIIAIVSLLVDSPVSPITSLLPLVIVIGVTATKQGYEDILRHRTDNVVNCSPVTVIRDGKETVIECQHIEPGDLVVISRDCDVPCDVVILKSSDARDKCFMTTANLDGETNLKTLIIPRGLPKVEISQMHQLGIIECESPKTDLYNFNGRIELFHSTLLDESQPTVLPLSADNVLLRGSRIKNTECVIGCAVYTGMTSKLALNSKLTRNKYASSEAYINWFLVFIIGAMVCICAYMCLMKWYVEANSAPETNYLGPTSPYAPGLFFQDYLSFVILFNYLIPISLYVTIELHRVFGGFFLEWDIELYDKETDEHFIVNTSDLNEDLGQINILFSDKTGTLTKNEMIFQRCSINGKKLVHKKTKLLDEDTDTLLDFNKFDNDQKNFFQGLVICHTVQVARRICETDPKIGTRIQPDSHLNVHEIFNQGITMNKSSTVKKVRSKTISFSKQGIEVPMKRLNSETDLSKNVKPAPIKTHRKSKSYGTSPVYITHTVNINGHRRTPSNVSRESYAIPNFIPRQPSMRLKLESMRRKKVLQAVVETLDYQASSPDEKALVEACADLGIVYLGDDNGIMNVRICPPHIDYSKPFSSAKVNEVPFERLHVLEFTSDRKRMSVVVKDEVGSIWIYTKGAENYVFSLCSSSSARLIEVTNTHINDFAGHGLRTLAVARKRITDEEYNNFLNELTRANVSLENRKQLTEECYSKIEQNLDLLGATAVQDALQDDVANTLLSLKKAGIKVWVLTGDKIETALNIALSCGHIPTNAMRYFILDCNHKEDLNLHLDMLDQEIIFGHGRPCALLIDGKSLTIALKDLPIKFRDISIRCQAVLCCRLSPLQKSEVVSLIKTCKEKYITAAIGDGANDVSMIQEAHIGIGIMGKEGRQAARCADFAFARFNMLTRLFLVHGQYFTIRLSMLVLYFFYKNILFMGIMFLFQYICMFSAQSVYDSWFLTFYNTLYSSLPVLFLSMTEKPFTEAQLMRKPELYAQNTHNKQLRWNCFLKWVAFGIFHTVIIFFFTFYLFSINEVVLNVGQTAELSVFGIQVMQAVVIVVNLKLWLESRYHSYWYIATIWGSIICFMVTTVNYNIIDMTFNTEIYWAYNKLFCSIPLWLLTIVCSIACLIPDYVILCCKEALNMPTRNVYSKIQRLIRL